MASDSELVLSPIVIAALRARLPTVATRTIAAVVAEVAEYAVPLQQGNMGANIENAVQLALAGFLRTLQAAPGSDPTGDLATALGGAYELGRGEARSGRSIDSLLAAYRVGARVAWREWGITAVEREVPGSGLVDFAERLFAYIDQLSASSVAGHRDQLAETSRVREQHLERLGRALLAAAPVEDLAEYAQRAEWEPPRTLTAVLVGSDRARIVAGAWDARTLNLPADVVTEGPRLSDDVRILLVPDTGRRRTPVWRALGTDPAVVGPCRPWMEAGRSYDRAARVLLAHGTAPGGLDTEEKLTELILTADREAVADLRRRELAPLADLPEATAERLTETLLSWLLHQGRREDVARDLTVHPQTVRYRMTQLRELLGDALQDRDAVLRLILALSAR
jgi:hypothetical protein